MLCTRVQTLNEVCAIALINQYVSVSSLIQTKPKILISVIYVKKMLHSDNYVKPLRTFNYHLVSNGKFKN